MTQGISARGAEKRAYCYYLRRSEIEIETSDIGARIETTRTRGRSAVSASVEILAQERSVILCHTPTRATATAAVPTAVAAAAVVAAAAAARPNILVV